MKIYQKSLKLMFINNYCTDFMFQEVMVCVTYLSSILSLIIFNFLLVSRYLKSLLKFVSTGFNYEINHKFQQNE